MVKLLVENGASLLKPKADGITILHVAASVNDIHTLDFALKNVETNSIDVQTKDVLSR